jgi:cellulose synthase/poly-beta-1,6-N-acetylglucosamine synthase-like glycosyltransferase
MSMNYLSLFLWLVLSALSTYWFVLALAAIRTPRTQAVTRQTPQNRFAIVIPSHNEENVIESTVIQLFQQNYPRELFTVFVVADFCADLTAQTAEKAGAVVLERNEGSRNGKGGALTWALDQVFAMGGYDAVVFFDADTRVDVNFLSTMDARLIQGEQVIQGQHIISNPDTGWFPALTWAMFLIDNRFQNLGRSNLGWSAKHMGDSICFRANVLKRIGAGQGLTEDYQLRQRLLLEGIRIDYEPRAIGYGEAALNWKQGQAQRIRWMQGVQDANRQMEHELLFALLKRRTGVLFDGWLQTVVPSYSTLTLISVVLLIIQTGINVLIQIVFSQVLLAVWGVLVSLLVLYPLFGLALERAPLRAYIAILLGPVFILWRTWLALTTRIRSKQVTWVRTDHHGTP